MNKFKPGDLVYSTTHHSYWVIDAIENGRYKFSSFANRDDGCWLECNLFEDGRFVLGALNDTE